MAQHIDKDRQAEFEQPEGESEKEAQEGKASYSKLIVALMFFTIIAYTVTCFVYLWNGKPLNDLLTGFFFGCFGFEFGSLAFIKSKKLKYFGGNAANKQPGHVEAIEEKEGETDGEVS